MGVFFLRQRTVQPESREAEDVASVAPLHRVPRAQVLDVAEREVDHLHQRRVVVVLPVVIVVARFGCFVLC